MEDDNLLKTLAREDVREEIQASFTNYLKTLIAALKNKNGKTTTETLMEHGKSDEEQALISELCEDIDAYHDNVKRCREAISQTPSLTEGAWLEQQLLAEANMLAQELEKRNLTNEEQQTLLQQLQQELMAEAEKESNMLNNELNTIGKEMEEPNV